MASRTDGDPATALRELLIDTADRMLDERPVSAVTTRQLAREAGVSDGVLYNYFRDKHDLLLAALVRRFERMADRSGAGLPTPGDGSVQENLLSHARSALGLIHATLPMAAGLMNEPVLLHLFFDAIHQMPNGPQNFAEPLTGYLRGERELGRIGDVDIDSAATLLLGATIMLAFTSHFQQIPAEHLERELPRLIATLSTGLGG